MQAVAEFEACRSVYLYTGGGAAYASVLFGVAKEKECFPDHGIVIPLEEYHHYNSQKAGDPAGPSVARALDTLHEGKRWGGQVYCLITESDAALFEASDRIFPLPSVRKSLASLYLLPAGSVVRLSCRHG